MGTRSQWAQDFLHALGNNNPDARTIALVVAWTAAEDTEATYNPLATTLDVGKNTLFNSVGVRNYADRNTGIAASVQSFGPINKPIKDALLRNDPEAALMAIKGLKWGTNTATLERIYRKENRAGEPLKSESGKINERSNTDAAPSAPIKTQAENITDISAEQVQKFLYVYLGVTLIVLGGILIIIDIGRRPAMQAARLYLRR